VKALKIEFVTVKKGKKIKQ